MKKSERMFKVEYTAPSKTLKQKCLVCRKDKNKAGGAKAQIAEKMVGFEAREGGRGHIPQDFVDYGKKYKFYPMAKRGH